MFRCVRLPAVAAAPLLTHALQLHDRLLSIKLTASRDIQRRNCRYTLKEALDAIAVATSPPLWGDPFLVDARVTRQARLTFQLLEGAIQRRDRELAGEMARDVKLTSRPLAEISRMLLAFVLGAHFPATMDCDDLLVSIVGWLPVDSARSVLSRFLKQGFVSLSCACPETVLTNCRVFLTRAFCFH